MLKKPFCLHEMHSKMASLACAVVWGCLMCLLLSSSVAADSEVATREVVDHVVCFAMRPLSPESEEKLLEALWQLQFTCAPDISILSLTAGRLLDWNNRINCSHALFVRYPTWEDLQAYWNHPCKTSLANDYIHGQTFGEIDVDIAGSVPDTSDAVLRTGKDFALGVDHFVHLKLKDGASHEEEEHILHRFDALADALGPDIVIQQTRGYNGFPRSQESPYGPHFTLGVASRLASVEAVNAYLSHPIYTEILSKTVDSTSYGFPPYTPREAAVMSM